MKVSIEFYEIPRNPGVIRSGDAKVPLYFLECHLFLLDSMDYKMK